MGLVTQLSDITPLCVEDNTIFTGVVVVVEVVLLLLLLLWRCCCGGGAFVVEAESTNSLFYCLLICIQMCDVRKLVQQHL